MAKPRKDLTGEVFGKYTVEGPAPDYISPTGHHSAMVWCVCECGTRKAIRESSLKNGDTVSCGCVPPRALDLTGQKYNMLFVEKMLGFVNGKRSRKSQCLCLCDCGNEKILNASDVRSGNIKSCGCLTKKAPSDRCLIDLVGQRFINCVVQRRYEENYISPKDQEDTQWVCLCDCGKEFIARGSNLRCGHTWCCGCKRKSSKAETIIENYLSENKINHTRGYKFDDLRSRKNWKLPFDFALLDENNNLLSLIEYQGEQHSVARKNDMFGYEQRTYTDKAKKEYCVTNNIPLYEIDYKENISSAIIEIVNTTYHVNSVPSSK